mmetsp:Transcript_13875/g.33562  ORF Transcript_13875/g.33562 Transcript_13875/m.33562 type:complete len:311 (+) Transcript_13875:61-993(+)
MRFITTLTVAASCLLLSCTEAFVMPSSPSTGAGVNTIMPTTTSKIRSPIWQSPFDVKSAAAAPSTSTSLNGAPKGFELFNLFYDDVDMAFNAWEWTANIGAPAALVAGAVLVTLGETREESAPRSTDLWWVRKAKMTMRFLLLSSFALEVISIFVSTMTGSVLLGHGAAKKAVGYSSALQLLHHHHEFEYLATQICFLQGLINWLGAVAIELVMPKESETKSARRVNLCLSSWLMSLVVWILAFYNHHLSFYSDYAHMLKRLFCLFVQRYFLEWRPLKLLYIPSFLGSTFLTWKAFRSRPEEDKEDEDDE